MRECCWWAGRVGGAGQTRLQPLLSTSVALSILIMVLCPTSQAATKSMFSVEKNDLLAVVENGVNWQPPHGGEDITGGRVQSRNQWLGVLRNVLKYEGAFAVTHLSTDYRNAVKRLREEAPDCLISNRFPEFVLPDGSLRTTFASDNAAYPACLAETGRTIGGEFDEVFDSISSLFEEITSDGEDNLTWRTMSDPDVVKRFSELDKKEHIHVYHSEDSESMAYAAPFHTDNGILLMITPFQDHPLKVKTVGGRTIDTSKFGDDTLLVLVARALPDWLLRGSSLGQQFVAAPHAVEALPPTIKTRTVFARMMVAPMDALPEGSNVDKLLFEQIFFNQDSDPTTSAAAGELCSRDDVQPRASSRAHSRVPRAHKHHQHNSEESSFEQLKEEECTGNTSYCWMGCYELDTCPTAEDRQICTNAKNENCCTDPADNDSGKCKSMDPSCRWKCAEPTPVPDRFCNGFGTDMYMGGFETSGDPNENCVILFFNVWILDTKAKFVFGCVGVILLGVFVEGMICIRRLVQTKKILRSVPALPRRIGIITLFGLNIGFGYLAMLVAMTYSVELFLCMVIGLVIGHAVFNSSAPVGESVDPCCASQVIGASTKMPVGSSVRDCHNSDDHSESLNGSTIAILT